MCHETQLKAAYNEDCRCYRFDSVFSPVRSYLSSAHLSIANLETTLPGDPYLYRGYPRFGSPDALVHALYNSGVDLLSLANNHSLDNARLGLVRTIQTVQRAGFYHLGTHTSRKKWKTKRFLLVKRRGFRLIFLNYSYGTNGIPVPAGIGINLMKKKLIAEDLKAAHSMSPDAVIVLFHFGKEYSRFPSARQKAYTQHAFRYGADVVLGSHPHVLQPYKIQKVKDIYGRRRKRLSAYSLGNFVSNQRQRYTNGGMIFYFDLIKKRSPSRKSEQILFGSIDYEPTWVYVEKKKGKKNFYVLPVKEFLENDKDIHLPPSDYHQMMRFYRDTRRHLRRSQAQVKRFSLQI